MRRAWITALFLVLAAVPVAAQTTGIVEGTVVDEKNVALPGVTVEGTSPNLQGTRAAVSDTSGKFRLVFLPPGTYSLKFTLQGFATVEQTNIRVELGRQVTLQVQMRSAFKEEVTVSGAAPVIDVRSTELGTSVDKQTFQNLPVQRNFASVILVAPGTNQDAVGVTVYGSTGAENGYFIDGVNTTGVERGLQGKVLNFEFIQEAQVKTASYQAEYGRATGGLINVVTKSGGNEFHGDVFGYYVPTSTESGLSSTVITDAGNGGVSSLVSETKQSDFGVDVGGFLVKDKLWFFAAYDHVKNDDSNQVFLDFHALSNTDYGYPNPGDVFLGTTKRNLWAGKLTFKINEGNSVIFSAFGDPSTFDGPGPGVALAANPTVFMRTIDSGGTDGTLKYEGVLGQNLVLNGQVAQHRDKNVTGGPGLTMIRLYDRADSLYTDHGITPSAGGYGPAQVSRFGRDIYRGDLSYFLANFGGDHEFKGGAEYEHITIDNDTFNTGGQRIYRFQKTYQGTLYTYYRHRFYITSPDLDPNTLTAADIVNPLVVNTKTNNTAAFIQDSWRIGSNLTFNLGFRWESQKLYNSEHQVAVDIKDNYAPRLGFVWDPQGNGRSKVYGSWGRYFETIPADMVIRSFGHEIIAFTYNLNGALSDPSRANVAADPWVNAHLRKNSILGGDTPVDPNLKGQYVEEYIFGGDLEVGRDFVVGAKYIHRSLGRVIEDMLTSTGNYMITNPGVGIGKVAFDYNNGLPWPNPKPERVFKGIELSVNKRFANNWQLYASYLWSKLEGNYDGTFQASTGQLDPNINSAYDYADFQINNQGPLSADRRHQVKINASYLFPFGLTAGAQAYWRSGTPITAYGYNFGYENWEYYLSERGAFGRTADQYEMDLHLGYPIKMSGVEVNLLFDVFNALNRQGEVSRDMQYDLVQDYEVFTTNADGTQLIPLPPIKPGDTTRPPTNPAFNHANAWQAPRTIRFGVRLTF